MQIKKEAKIYELLSKTKVGRVILERHEKYRMPNVVKQNVARQSVDKPSIPRPTQEQYEKMTPAERKTIDDLIKRTEEGKIKSIGITPGSPLFHMQNMNILQMQGKTEQVIQQEPVGITETKAKKEHGYISTDKDYEILDKKAQENIENIKIEKQKIRDSLQNIAENQKNYMSSFREFQKFKQQDDKETIYFFKDKPDETYSHSEMSKILGKNLFQERMKSQQNIKTFIGGILTYIDLNKAEKDLQKNITSFKEYREKGYDVTIKNNTAFFHEPDPETLHKFIYGESNIRPASIVVQEWGIPSAINIFSHMVREGTNIYKGVALGVLDEKNRLYTKSIELTQKKGENIVSYTQRYIPEFVEYIAIPVATVGLGSIYTKIALGAKGAVPPGVSFFSNIGIKYGAKAPKAIEYTLLGAGFIGSGVAGYNIGYAFATSQNEGIHAIGKTVESFIKGISGFYAGSYFTQQKYISSSIGATGKNNIARMIRHDIDIRDSPVNVIVEKATSSSDRIYMYWKPDSNISNRYSISEVSGYGFMKSASIQDDVESIAGVARVAVSGKPQKYGFLGLGKIEKTSFYDYFILKSVKNDLERIIPFKDIYYGRHGAQSLYGKSYGFIDKIGVSGTIKLPLGEKIISNIKKEDIHAFFSRGKYFSIEKDNIIYGTIRTKGYVTYFDKFNYGLPKSTLISSSSGSYPSGTTYQSMIFKLRNVGDVVGQSISNFISSTSSASGSLLIKQPSVKSVFFSSSYNNKLISANSKRTSNMVKMIDINVPVSNLSVPFRNDIYPVYFTLFTSYKNKNLTVVSNKTASTELKQHDYIKLLSTKAYDHEQMKISDVIKSTSFVPLQTQIKVTKYMQSTKLNNFISKYQGNIKTIPFVFQKTIPFDMYKNSLSSKKFKNLFKDIYRYRFFNVGDLL